MMHFYQKFPWINLNKSKHIHLISDVLVIISIIRSVIKSLTFHNLKYFESSFMTFSLLNSFQTKMLTVFKIVKNGV